MGKPAARLGDSTAHGGVITVGAPTVLICGQPAARLGDMTSCPMAVPAPTPIPHVGGPITLGSAGVLICGMPAARMGDQALCPPMGPAPIVVGAPTVLIGETGPGGGGGGAGAGGGGGSQGEGGSGDGGGPGSGEETDGSGSSEAGDTDPREDHFLEVGLVDKGGHPITGVRYEYEGPEGTQGRGWVNGGFAETGVPAGNYDVKITAITKAAWSASRLDVGEEAKLQVETAGIENGTFAKLDIFLRDTNRPDEVIHTIETKVDADKIEETWTFSLDENYLGYQDAIAERGGYSNPLFGFKVTIGSLESISGMLSMRDNLALTVEDPDGKTLADRAYRVRFLNGEIRTGTTNGDGVAELRDIPPGRYFFTMDVRE